jgi:hypothetical protein
MNNHEYNASPYSNGDSIEAKSILSALDDIDIQGGGTERENEGSEYTHSGQRLEAAFLIPESLVEEEVQEDIGFGRGVSGVPYAPEPPVPVRTATPPMPSEYDQDDDGLDQDQGLGQEVRRNSINVAPEPNDMNDMQSNEVKEFIYIFICRNHMYVLVYR